jgi:Cu+-exporting ATPase
LADIGKKEFGTRGDYEETKDPVCGVVVEPDTPFKHQYDGRKYYFCSDRCMYKFMQEPSMYAAA